MLSYKINNFINNKDGFTLPELLVSIAIITIVTAILLFRYDAFNSTALLNNQSYEMALDIRQAQVAGVSVRAGSGTSRFDEEFGVYVSMSQTGQYIYFRDSGSTEPAAYNSGEEVEVSTLDARFSIAGICANAVSLDCVGGTKLSEVSISFARPNFDAKFKGSDGGGNNVSGIESVSIALQPNNNSQVTRLVHVSSSGQISVE